MRRTLALLAVWFVVDFLIQILSDDEFFEQVRTALDES